MRKKILLISCLCIAALIVELKKNKSAASGIDQIKEKKYYESLEHYEGDLIFVGVNYDEDTKEHSCRIERTRY